MRGARAPMDLRAPRGHFSRRLSCTRSYSRRAQFRPDVYAPRRRSFAFGGFIRRGWQVARERTIRRRLAGLDEAFTRGVMDDPGDGGAEAFGGFIVVSINLMLWWK